MKKKEYLVSQLNLACIALGEARDTLTRCPELKKKVEEVREEVQRAYEREYNEWKDNQ